MKVQISQGGTAITDLNKPAPDAEGSLTAQPGLTNSPNGSSLCHRRDTRSVVAAHDSAARASYDHLL